MDELPSDDILPWVTEVEELLEKWGSDCSVRSTAHAVHANKKRRLYRIIGIPSILVPICMASFSRLYSDCDTYEVLLMNSLGYLVSGSLAGVGTFFNFGQQYAQHAQYEILYYELYTEIECILAKPANFRGHADVILGTFRLKYDSLNRCSPDL
jgi:hypothetical protein